MRGPPMSLLDFFSPLQCLLFLGRCGWLEAGRGLAGGTVRCRRSTVATHFAPAPWSEHPQPQPSWDEHRYIPLQSSGAQSIQPLGVLPILP